MNKRTYMFGALAICGLGLCGCKSSDKAEDPAAATATACEKCPEGECKCEAKPECTKCEGECKCEPKAECTKCEGECACG